MLDNLSPEIISGFFNVVLNGYRRLYAIMTAIITCHSQRVGGCPDQVEDQQIFMNKHICLIYIKQKNKIIILVPSKRSIKKFSYKN